MLPKMRLKINFDELKDAIELASFEHHYFIDKKNHQILFISEYERDYEKKLEAVESDNFMGIEPRTPEDDFDTMRSFVYTIPDLKIAQTFEAALGRKKPFRHFKELLDFYPEIKEKWFKHKDQEMINTAMNWLCMNNIDLEDQSFIPKIMIQELMPDEVKLPEEFAGFGPIECMKCNNQEGIKRRYFELNVPSENMLIEKEIKRIMKEKYGLEDYGHIGGGEKEILTSSECQKCKSREIFEDF